MAVLADTGEWDAEVAECRFFGCAESMIVMLMLRMRGPMKNYLLSAAGGWGCGAVLVSRGCLLLLMWWRSWSWSIFVFWVCGRCRLSMSVEIWNLSDAGPHLYHGRLGFSRHFHSQPNQESIKQAWCETWSNEEISAQRRLSGIQIQRRVMLLPIVTLEIEPKPSNYETTSNGELLSQRSCRKLSAAAVAHHPCRCRLSQTYYEYSQQLADRCG